VHRFLLRIWSLFEKSDLPARSGEIISQEIDKLVLKVGSDIEAMKFNTAISSMMEFLNMVQGSTANDKGYTWGEVWEKFLLVLAPYAPHVTEELWRVLKGESAKSIHGQSWPVIASKDIKTIHNVVVTINSKPRGVFEVKDIASKMTEDQLITLASQEERVKLALEGRKIKKVIYVAGKILNLVVE